jgi:YidC/Oxa1 family membrane protein insertase
MGYVIKFCNWIMGNQYLFALLIFAIIIEIILLPFGIKQQKNSIKQAKLRPKEMAIRKKYAGRDDKPTQQKMTQEIQTLYQKEGYNPMGGCLPLLIQFPIIIALYNIVLNPLRYICGLSADAIANVANVTKSFTGIEYDVSRNLTLASDMRNVISTHGVGVYSGIEGFAEHIQDIADVPQLSFLNRFDLGLQPSLIFSSFAQNWWLLFIPVVTFLAYFFSMKITRKLTYQPVTDDKAMGCSNNMMDFMMPLMSVYIAFITPAAIGVYWIFKSLLGVVKQAILKKAMPIPVFTEEDYKAAEKEMNVRPEKTPKNKSGRVVRSLHHIDDEDFADTADAAKARREALEAQEAADAAKKAEAGKKGILSAAPIKKDDKKEEKKENDPENDTEK